MCHAKDSYPRDAEIFHHSFAVKHLICDVLFNIVLPEHQIDNIFHLFTKYLQMGYAQIISRKVANVSRDYPDFGDVDVNQVGTYLVAVWKGIIKHTSSCTQ